MLSLMLAAALTAGTTAPGHGYYSGCYGCYGCSGGYPYFAAAPYRPPVSYSGCGCWGGSGCFGGGFGGGAYGCGGCYGSWANMAPSYAGCGGCSGSLYVPMYAPSTMRQATDPVMPMPGESTAPRMEKADDKDEKKGGKVIEDDATSAAKVVVKAALGVRVTVNGLTLDRLAETDTFLTPPLSAAGSYSYQVVATATRGGKPVTETRRVPVAAGARVEVDFTSLGSAAARAEAASVTIVARKGAAVRFNGTAVEVDGRRTFETPALEAGREYFYTVEVDVTRDGKRDTMTRRVAVEPGKAVTVDLTESATVAAR